MEETLVALLLSIESLTNLVGSRIRYGRASQTDARPYVVMQLVSEVPNYQLNGPSGYVESRFQIDCYAETYGDVKRVARAVTSALSGYRAAKIQGIFIDSQKDLPAADAGNVATLFRTSIDIIVHHGEPRQ